MRAADRRRVARVVFLLLFFISFDFVAVSRHRRRRRGGVFNPRPSSLDRNRHKELAPTTIIYNTLVSVCREWKKNE